jgi:sigma-54 dependent transcriptional regulator, acetoin dehydrogenase operon transcriptional activator AcoR
MPDVLSPSHSPSPAPDGASLSPLASVLLDGFNEGLVVFDADGRVVYANLSAREALAKAGVDSHGRAAELQPRLTAMGGRLRPLRVGELEVGAAMFIPVAAAAAAAAPATLADREKEAIVRMLDANGWKLSETAKHLGISRTTLWRRLKTYGLHRDNRSTWAHTS